MVLLKRGQKKGRNEMDKIIEVQALRKSFGDVKAVNGIDFYVEKGSLFAFLGPNGAGKSTTIDMISTQLKPDMGRIYVGGYMVGKDDNTIRRKIGIVFQDSVLDPLLTVKENLFLRGSLYGMDKARLKNAVFTAAHTADVMDFYNRPYGKLSGGQRRRADIARALVNTPEILFLDEPTTGLDPQTRHKVWDTISRLQKESNMTIFLTTHYMEEAARADYITIMDHGKILAKDTPAALKEQYTKDILKMTPKNENALADCLVGRGIAFEKTGGDILVRLDHTIDAVEIVNGCRDAIYGLEVRRGTMDDVFLNITGDKVRD